MTVLKTTEFSIFNTDGEKTDSSKSLEFSVSGSNANYLIHKALIYQNHEQAQKSANSKTRSEVRGGGRKPWKQKGTGRARAGSNRSPLWKGGGVIFGPKPIKRAKKINKKEWNLAIRTLLYNKSSNLLLVQDFENVIKDSKTSIFAKFLKTLNINTDSKVLIIYDSKDHQLSRVCRNIENLELVNFNKLNPRSLLHTNYILCDTATLKKVEETYAR
jgi:large subunit ribosomal protein L4